MKKLILSLSIALTAIACPSLMLASQGEAIASTSQQGDDIDKTLSQYDRYVQRLSKLVDRALNGDMDAVADLQSMIAEGEKLSAKLDKMKETMNEDQQNRLAKTTQALMEVYQKVNN